MVDEWLNQAERRAIEQKSDQNIKPYQFVGELVGIDVERPNTYFTAQAGGLPNSRYGWLAGNGAAHLPLGFERKLQGCRSWSSMPALAARSMQPLQRWPRAARAMRALFRQD